MNREKRISYLKEILDQKIKEREYKYQESLAVLALLIAADSISNYFINPLVTKISFFNGHVLIINCISYVISCIVIFTMYFISKRR